MPLSQRPLFSSGSTTSDTRQGNDSDLPSEQSSSAIGPLSQMPLLFSGSTISSSRQGNNRDQPPEQSSSTCRPLSQMPLFSSQSSTESQTRKGKATSRSIRLPFQSLDTELYQRSQSCYSSDRSSPHSLCSEMGLDNQEINRSSQQTPTSTCSTNIPQMPLFCSDSSPSQYPTHIEMEQESQQSEEHSQASESPLSQLSSEPYSDTRQGDEDAPPHHPLQSNAALSQLTLFSSASCPSSQSQSVLGHQNIGRHSRLRTLRPRPTNATSSSSLLVSRSPSSSLPSPSPQSSQRRAPPRGKRRVYTCTSASGAIRTECGFEGMTCLFDNSLPRSRESLLQITGVFEKYMTCLIQHVTPLGLSSVLDHMAALVLYTKDDGSFDEKRSFSVVQCLVKFQRHVANVAQHTIGRLIDDLHTQTHISKNTIVCELCNFSEREKEREYTFLLQKCAQTGCGQCVAAMQSDRDGRSTLVTPCTPLQACCRLLELEYQNFTPSFLRQCLDMACLSLFSPIVVSAEPPSSVRTALAPRAHKESKSLPSILAGLAPVFPLQPGRTAIEAIQYCDGDGGYIVVEHFLHLQKYLDTLPAAPRFIHLKEHRCRMIPFRELYHDAVELGHEYDVTVNGQPQTCMKWGYEALVCARKGLANAQLLWIVPTTSDRSGDRLLLEIYTLESGEQTPRSTGIRLIEAGLSYLVRDSPQHYKEAWKSAIEGCQGIHKYGLASVDELHPAHLKQSLTSEKSRVTSVDVSLRFQGTLTMCKVSNNRTADYLNEANIWIMRSLIPGAGIGLFLKPTLPGKKPIFIPEKKAICLYSDTPCATISSVSSDYVMEVEQKGTCVLYNPITYNGKNIGRFINQGGLMEGIKEMCISCDKKKGGRGLCQRDIHRAMEKVCNTQYSILQDKKLYVVASRDLRSCLSPTELLANYSYTYWTRYVENNWQKMGHQHPVVNGILWCYFSENSILCGQGNINIPDSIKAQLKKADCPYNQSRRST